MERLLPDGRVRICSGPHGRDSSLRAPLRGIRFRRRDLNAVKDLKQVISY